MSTHLQVGPQGRVVIPAALRQAMGIEPGSVLVAQVLDGKLVLETQAQVLNQFFSRFAQARMQARGSVADELITERRGQAADE
ncbi:MAG TPA: AbrB/MazE/SpoVT family DNA-binding domain-containing protein [Rhodoferax sp.]